MEYIWKRIRLVMALVGLALCLWLVIDGQKHIGLPGIGQMLLGLLGILFLLWLYNKQFR